MKHSRPCGRVVDEDEVMRITAEFDDGTDYKLPLLKLGRGLVRFRVDGVIYAPVYKDFDDIEVE